MASSWALSHSFTSLDQRRPAPPPLPLLKSTSSQTMTESLPTYSSAAAAPPTYTSRRPSSPRKTITAKIWGGVAHPTGFGVQSLWRPRASSSSALQRESTTIWGAAIKREHSSTHVFWPEQERRQAGNSIWGQRRAAENLNIWGAGGL